MALILFLLLLLVNMARNYHVSKLPIHRNLFGDPERMVQIIGSESSIKDLLVCLRGVISHGKKEPLSNFEEDVLSDLYNSVSLFNFK